MKNEILFMVTVSLILIDFIHIVTSQENGEISSNTITITSFTKPAIENFIDNVKIEKQEEYLIIKHKNINITLQPLFHYNSNNYTIVQAKLLVPSLTFSQEIITENDYYKWIPSISGIPESLRGKFNITLNLVEANGITWDDVRLDNKTIVLFEKIKVDFSDLLATYSVSLLTKRNVLIHNINCTWCVFDPRIGAFNISELFVKRGNESLFNITSSTISHFVGDVKETREWGYDKSGYEIVRTSKPAVIQGDFICMGDDYTIFREGTLAETTIYHNCIYYPRQFINISVKPYENIDPDGKKTILNTTIKQVRNITQISPTEFKVEFPLNNYDPTIQNLTVGLLHYWAMDDLKGGAGALFTSDNHTFNTNDLAVLDVGGGDDEPDYTTTGCKFSGCYSYDGSTDRIYDESFDFTHILSNDTVTVCAWAYLSCTPGGGDDKGVIMHTRANGGTEYPVLLRADHGDQGGDTLFNAHTGAADCAASTTDIGKDGDVWSHMNFVCGQFNGTHSLIWINGTLKSTTLCSFTTLAIDGDDMWVGARGYDSANEFCGIIDEVGLWSTALNSSQILRLWNNSAGLAYPFEEEAVADTTPPTVTLIAPANNSAWDTDNTPDFNFSAYDDTAITNCTLFINNTFNKSQTTNANFTNNPISNGSYEWFVNCSDAIPNWGYSGFFNLKINVSIPTDTCSCPSINSNWIVSDHCQITASCSIGTGIINITTGGWLNISGSGIVVNASKIRWLPKTATDVFRLRWQNGAKIRWGEV